MEAENREQSITERLEYLRGEIRAERISYGEIAELQGLADHIDPGDVELLEWAGVPEDAVKRNGKWELMEAENAEEIGLAYNGVVIACREYLQLHDVPVWAADNTIHGVLNDLDEAIEEHGGSGERGTGADDDALEEVPQRVKGGDIIYRAAYLQYLHVIESESIGDDLAGKFAGKWIETETEH